MTDIVWKRLEEDEGNFDKIKKKLMENNLAWYKKTEDDENFEKEKKLVEVQKKKKKWKKESKEKENKGNKLYVKIMNLSK